ncbi:SAF domain-containing protein [Bifidobacterium sp. ESL0775]|uniref:SAF domain-containing protein n=1 Tax=Bifidobacterium sp. ESL0775 TaxID=2983230 RepID=UPI0023F88564|nr:SAF domain-containing protein [Bifidobacterium sp. ESL0775]WEV69042.1 SAF domain-containing protein [Bifidobacterium sp. ESL0775]
MTNHFHIGGQPGEGRKPTLKQRRDMRRLRTLLAALCAGLAVFFALQSVTSSMATKSVVTAVHAIKRGHTINADDVRLVNIADSPALSTMFTSNEAVDGLVAQVDIAAGSVISRPMARASPIVGHGLTVIDVRVSGSQASLIVGDKVSLVGSAGCESVPNPISQPQPQGQQPANAPNAENQPTADDAGSDGSGNGQTPADAGETGETDGGSDAAPMESTGRICTLAPKATVTGNPHRDDGGITTARLAMPPQDASRVMAVQERMPIMAARL